MPRLNRQAPRAILIVVAVLFCSVPASWGQTLNERAVLAIQGQDLKPPFDFVVMGDPQGYYKAAAKLLADAQRFNPAFAIFLGDLTPRGEEQQYQDYLAMIQTAKMPVLSVIGNHDINAPTGRASYERIFGKPDFSFDAGGRRFIILDSAEDKLSTSQLTWLTRALGERTSANSADPPRAYIFTHEPPFMGNWWLHSFVDGTPEFLSLMAEHRVPWVFIGHLHVLDGFDWNGTRFLVVGSGGIIPHSLPFGKVARCLVRVHVTQQGEQIEVYGLQGERIEAPQGLSTPFEGVTSDQ